MAYRLFLRGLGVVADIGRGLVAKTAPPVFSEAERLFMLSPRLLGQEVEGRLTQPYRQHGWVYAAIRAISQNIAGVDLLLYTGDRNDKRLIEDHPALELLDKPNPYMNAQQLMEATMTYLELAGEAFWIAERPSPRVLPKEVWCFDPRRFQEQVGENGLISGWEYKKGVKTIEFAPYEVVHFRYINPYNDYRGMGPIEAARLGIEQDYLASRYNRAFFKNYAQPGGFLETDESLLPEEYDRLLAQFNQRHGGATKAWKIGLLEGGVKYKAAGLSQKDMDFLEQRRWSRDEILAVFKVPKGEVAVYEDINYATARTQDKVFWTKTLLPKMSLVEWVIYDQLLDQAFGGKLWAEFDYGKIDVLEDDYKDKVETAVKMWSMGIPLNEINERLNMGLNDIEGGDVGYIPFNVTPVEQKLNPPKPPPFAPGGPPPEEPEAEPEEEPEEEKAVRAVDEEAYWRTFVDLHSRLETRVLKKVKRFFFEQRALQLRIIEEKLGKGIERQLDVGSLLFPLGEEDERLRRVMWPLYIEIANAAGQALYTEMGLAGDLFNVQDTEAIHALGTKLIKVTRINATTREALRKTITEALYEMESWKEISERIREVYNFASSRANTIARTEVGQSMMTARFHGMTHLGVEKIRWTCAMDERVRVSHLNLHGAETHVGTPFANGCKFPSDPDGPASEVINCRCVASPVGLVRPPKPEHPTLPAKFVAAQNIAQARKYAKEVLGYKLTYGPGINAMLESTLVSWPRENMLQILNDQNEIYLAMKKKGIPLLPVEVKKHATWRGKVVGAAYFEWDWQAGAKRIVYGLYDWNDYTKSTIRGQSYRTMFQLDGDGYIRYFTEGSNVWHENGHYLHFHKMNNKVAYNRLRKDNWPYLVDLLEPGLDYEAKKQKVKSLIGLVKQEVSNYAATNPVEMVAEMYSGMRLGRTYSPYMTQLYHYISGPEVLK